MLKEGFNLIYDKNGVELRTKFRYVDPEVAVNGFYKNLSSLSEEYSRILNLERGKSKSFKKVKIIPKKNGNPNIF